MSNLHIYTYGSDLVRMDTLLQSIQINGINLNVRGHDREWEGNIDKVSQLHTELASLPPNDIFMFVDAYDVAIVSSEEEILENFHAYDAPFVISAEKPCWPDDHIRQYYPPSDSPYAFLNSGTYIGYVWAVLEYFDYCSKFEGYRVPTFDGIEQIPHAGSDQRCLTTWYLNHTDKAILDSEQRIFSTLAETPLESFELLAPNRIINLDTGHRTCVLHGNSAEGMLTLVRLWFRVRSLSIIK